MRMTNVGKMLLALGLALALVGLVIMTGDRLGLGRFPLGRLPGDLRFERRGVQFYFPLTSSILVSLLVSGILYLWRHGFRK
jgi:hypothetical protein